MVRSSITIANLLLGGALMGAITGCGSSVDQPVQSAAPPPNVAGSNGSGGSGANAPASSFAGRGSITASLVNPQTGQGVLVITAVQDAPIAGGQRRLLLRGDGDNPLVTIVYDFATGAVLEVVYQFDNGASIPSCTSSGGTIPVCVGVSLSVQAKSVTFANTRLRSGDGTGAQTATLNGSANWQDSGG